MLGFKFAYRPSGTAPTIQTFNPSAEENITTGDILVEVAGKVKVGATAGSKFLGVALQTKKPAKTTDTIQCIIDSDAVYGVEDANARSLGDTLDLAGTTGKQTVAASNNKEFVVVTNKSASQETLVRFNIGKHLYNTAQ